MQTFLCEVLNTITFETGGCVKISNLVQKILTVLDEGIQNVWKRIFAYPFLIV